MDAYDAGTLLFTTAIAECFAAARLATNPFLSQFAGMTGLMVGTVLSSPSDIAGGKESMEQLGREVVEAASALEAAFRSISEDEWKKMGRDAAEEAAKKFTKDAHDVKIIFDALSDIMGHLASQSMEMAVACASSATIILGLAVLNNMGKFLGPAAVATEASTVASGNALVMALKGIVSNYALLFAKSAALSAGIQVMFAQKGMTALQKASHPTTGVPQFEQVYIPDLPTTDKKGKPLGDA
ncbi:hypothetical protein [Nonomuraea sp. NPDC050691]|uniref:hypothetical protein n=1 Tax=Nonomuraea sp. NPDC050691 TaxID=3155661 RepID=UPI0033D79B36